MILIDELDEEAKRFIQERKDRLNLIFDKAEEQLELGNKEEVRSLLQQARSLSFHAGKGLKVKIMNEKSDCELHQVITEVIETLN